VGSALLSVAVSNTLRTHALVHTDFRHPDQVLSSLNQVYQMADHNDLYATVWYGVYHRPSGVLRYASAGHPPAIVVSGPRDRRGEAQALRAEGPILGMLPSVRYSPEEYTLRGPARLFLLSDGVFEIRRPDDSMLPFEEFQEALTRAVPDGASDLAELLQFAQRERGGPLLEDDFSVVKVTIGSP
jgi:sigma-B regulation protein RsbU (phosphoserine phosphatase)